MSRRALLVLAVALLAHATCARRLQKRQTYQIQDSEQGQYSDESDYYEYDGSSQDQSEFDEFKNGNENDGKLVQQNQYGQYHYNVDQNEQNNREEFGRIQQQDEQNQNYQNNQEDLDRIRQDVEQNHQQVGANPGRFTDDSQIIQLSQDSHQPIRIDDSNNRFEGHQPNQEDPRIPPNQQDPRIPPNQQYPRIPPNQQDPEIEPNQQDQVYPTPFQNNGTPRIPNAGDELDVHERPVTSSYPRPDYESGYVPPGYNKIPGFQKTNARYKFFNRAVSWVEAAMKCASDGARIAVPESEEEAKALGGFLVKHSGSIKGTRERNYVYLGFNDLAEEGRFITLDGDEVKSNKNPDRPELVYANWQKGEPNNADGKDHCAQMNDKGMYWDGRCDDKLAFICKYVEKPCIPRVNNFNQ